MKIITWAISLKIKNFKDPNVKPANLQMRGIQWLSPEKIRPHHDDQYLKWSVYSDPKFNDIKTGRYTGSWILCG
jgi:hypothetical protein